MATLATTTTGFASAAQSSPAEQLNPSASSGMHGPAIAVSTVIIAIAALVTLTLIALIVYLSYRRRRTSLHSTQSHPKDENNNVDLEKCVSTPTAPTPTLAIETSDEHTYGRMPYLQPRLVAHCQPLGTRHITSFSQVPPATATIQSGDHIRVNFAKLIKSSRLDLGAAFSSVPLAPPRKANSDILQKVCNLKPPPAAKLSPKPVQGPGIITRDWSLRGI